MTHKNYWNWQQEDWISFTYESEKVESFEREFLRQAGISLGVIKHITDDQKQEITINLISDEAYNSSKIEGEILDRDSLQSSIKRQFGLKAPLTSNSPAENGIAEMMIDLYQNFNKPLSHEVLFEWHKMLMNGRRDISNIGSYRTHLEPMQVVSGAIYEPKVHFEAPPSDMVFSEMEAFIKWFNKTAPDGTRPLTPLIRSGIAHLYFVSIHPFEDGNGRIGRAIVEKVLAQELKLPSLIALSEIIDNKKKAYYDALEKQNKYNHITSWLEYFSKTILQAQKYTIKQVEFVIQTAKFFDRYKHQLNDRQTKVIARILKEGPSGFKGGLSAKNYMVIAGTSSTTATRDLKDLVAKNILSKTGDLKSTRYWLKLYTA